MQVNGYKDRILEEIASQDKSLFSTGETGVFFNVGRGKIAKVFFRYGLGPENNPQVNAEKEYDNLLRIIELKDDRLIVPKPYDVINLGRSTDIESLLTNPDMIKFPKSYNTKETVEYDMYATIMQYLPGKNLDRIDSGELGKYIPALNDMVEAFVEHGIGIPLGTDEVICLEDSDKVGFVDVNVMTWFDNTKTRDYERYEKHYMILGYMGWKQE